MNTDSITGLKLASPSSAGFSANLLSPITDKELKVSESEKRACRSWFDKNIRTKTNPAYDFNVGGHSFRRHLREWDIMIGEETAAERGGKDTTILLFHKPSSLSARVETTIFEDKASCHWTVFIKNEGDSPSPVIRHFYAADCLLEIETANLLVSRGSDSRADDFELLHTPVTATQKTFGAEEGRNSTFLPYFNLSGSERGAVLAIGWTGQWSASFRKESGRVRFRAKQESFDAYLDPGEEVRSPMISITFYDSSNPLKGFESFRRMEIDCLFPGSFKPMTGLMLANEFCTLKCEELIEKVDSTKKDVLGSIDYFWMDAGWYKYDRFWYDGVGNWTPDESRFPDTLKPLSDAIKDTGNAFLLWYEPERIREGTMLAVEGARHSGWTIRNGNNIMWNMANYEACSFLTDLITKSLSENGISIYRQDFNFDPLQYWKKADKELYGKRKGICENHYVTNLYRFLDELAVRTKGLLIDNCASGGRRIDIEMCRRSIPLWRSDYSCIPADGTKKADLHEATQAMTSGLSFWLPFSGTMQHFENDYAAKSGILTHPVIMDTKGFKPYDRVRSDMTKNYFPLTDGGADKGNTLAMQFGDELNGSALIFTRECSQNVFLLRLNGLSPERIYLLTDEDDPGFSVRENGRALMGTGIETKNRIRPNARIIYYDAEQ